LVQAAGVTLAFLFVAALHRQSDGLWFQGDAPRHAVNGLFWWDLLRALPRDPLHFAVRYYARYPVIAPASYPPLFYVLEGLAFSIFGPSPYSGRAVVLLCACIAGLYTTAWARRWIAPFAGWAGAFLAFVPGMVLWSNTVMLNVPATAAGLASMYHFRRWFESGRPNQLMLTVCAVTAGLLTYYPTASVLPILAAWGLWRIREFRFDRRSLWVVAAILLAIVPLLAALRLAPVHTSRQIPTLAFLARVTTWTFYWKMLSGVVGPLTLTMGAAGCAAGIASPRWRVETIYIVLWIVVLIGCLSVVPARDPRYVLLAAPAFVLAAFTGIAVIQTSAAALAPAWQSAVLTVALAGGTWLSGRIDVPQVSGFREAATYFHEQAPTDGVLYDGDYDGLFGFFFRALDPLFQQRMVVAHELLYRYGPSTTFDWVQQSNVASTEDVVRLVRTRSGCRWVAIEMSRNPVQAVGQRLLRDAVKGPEFEWVRAFPISGAGERRVDVYRVLESVDQVSAVDLSFPSLSERVFVRISPITR
jgi:hypothetical protein